HRHAALLRELFEHDRSQRVQPLVLRFHIAGEFAALGFSASDGVLDLEQGIPAADAFLDGGGHAALLLELAGTRTPQVSWPNHRRERRVRPSLEQAFLRTGPLHSSSILLA